MWLVSGDASGSTSNSNMNKPRKQQENAIQDELDALLPSHQIENIGRGYRNDKNNFITILQFELVETTVCRFPPKAR